MTWTRVRQTGQGKLEFRVSIEGLDHEFVTHKSMEVAAIASTSVAGRYVGLHREGITRSSSVDFSSAILKSDGMTLRVSDVALKATEAFARLPTVTTYLTANCTLSDTSISVSSTTGWAVNDQIHINTEAMRITSFSNEDPFAMNVSRSVYGTEALYHYTEDGEKLRFPEVNNVPVTLEGRRVRVYAYGDGDNMTANGTQIYLGIIKADPRLADIGTWEIGIDPITRALDQDLGWDPKQSISIRGIYYPWNCPLILTITQTDGDSSVISSTETEATGSPFVISGFWETQQDFVNYLNTLISGAATTPFVAGSGCLRFITGDNGTIRVQYQTGNPARYIRMVFYPTARIDSLDGAGMSTDTDHWVDPSGNWDKHLNVSTVYEIGWHTSYPRSAALCFRSPLHPYPTTITNLFDSSAASVYPDNRIYFDGSSTAITSGTVMVSNSSEKYLWPATWRLTADGGSERYFEVNRDDVNRTAYDSAAGTATVSTSYFLPEGGMFGGMATSSTSEYESTSHYTMTLFADTVSGATNLKEYLADIAADSRTYSTIGMLPSFTSTDYNTSESATNIDAARNGKALANNRGYSLFQRRKLSEMIAEECKILGCFPALDLNGKIVIKRMSMPTESSVAATAITSSGTLVDGSMPKYEKNGLGLINTATYETGYNIFEDKHEGSPVIVRDVVGIGINRTPKGMKISPYSTDGTPPTFKDITALASEYFAVLGSPYVIYTVRTTLAYHDTALVGSVISFVNAQLPDESDNTRGWVTPKMGIVIGEEWDYSRGSGWLTLYAPLVRVAGYTPTCRITAATNTSGTTWTLDISQYNWDALSTSYWDSGATLAGYFPVGSLIQIYQWDNASPTVVEGAVASLVDADTLTVTLTGAWVPGVISTTNAWQLAYDLGDTPSLLAAQTKYAYVAGTNLKIQFDTIKDARIFGA